MAHEENTTASAGIRLAGSAVKGPVWEERPLCSQSGCSSAGSVFITALRSRLLLLLLLHLQMKLRHILAAALEGQCGGAQWLQEAERRRAWAALQKVREEAAALNGEFTSSRRSTVELRPHHHHHPDPPTTTNQFPGLEMCLVRAASSRWLQPVAKFQVS